MSNSVITTSPNVWNILGTKIDSVEPGDRIVSMNAAGDRVAIGEPGYSNGKGRVGVFKLNGKKWTQIDKDIVGAAANSECGRSVSMNGLGDRFVVGEPGYSGLINNRGRVITYKIEDDKFVPYKENSLDYFEGNEENERFGSSVSMNQEGNRVVASSPGFDGGKGKVYLYTQDPNNLTNYTSTSSKEGESNDVRFGSSVSMDASGYRVAVSEPTINSSGRVVVFETSPVDWVQLTEVKDVFSSNPITSVSISKDGKTVAIGATGSTTTDNNGLVMVYKDHESSSNGWTKLGDNIVGKANSRTGTSVSINEKGNRVAVGAPGYDGKNKTDNGKVSVYELQNSGEFNHWKQIGKDINGGESGAQSGHSVSMNAAGDKVAIGGSSSSSSSSGGSLTNNGNVGVYEYIKSNATIALNQAIQAVREASEQIETIKSKYRL